MTRTGIGSRHCLDGTETLRDLEVRSISLPRPLTPSSTSSALCPRARSSRSIGPVGVGWVRLLWSIDSMPLLRRLFAAGSRCAVFFEERCCSRTHLWGSRR